MCSTDGNQPRRARFEIAGSATPIDAARVRTSRARRRAVARCGEARGASLLPRVVRPSPYGRRVPAWKYLDPVQPTPSVPAIPPTPSEALAGPGAATAQDCLFAVDPRRTGSAARLVAGVLRRPPARPPHHAGRGRGRHRTNHPDARSHSLNVPEPLVPTVTAALLLEGPAQDCGPTDPDSSRQEAPETSAENVMAERRRASPFGRLGLIAGPSTFRSGAGRANLNVSPTGQGERVGHAGPTRAGTGHPDELGVVRMAPSGT